MGKKHIFNAGPCLLPQVAIDNAIEALKDFKGTGVSLISISHRTKGWDEVMDECRSTFRRATKWSSWAAAPPSSSSTWR